MAERMVQQPPTTGAQKQFDQLPAAEIERSTFDRSASIKTTMEAGDLVPVLVDEILPGDSFDVDATLFVRLATPLKPIMDSIHMDIHFFFVPNRIVWDNWQFFMGERIDPDDDPTTVTIPQATLRLQEIEGKLADYFGLPLTTDAVSVSVNALPFRGYYKCFDDWYRDQNFERALNIDKGDAPVDFTDFDVKKRYKRKDYFTSALPFPQKGDPVFLPLGTSAPIEGIGISAAANPVFNSINVNETGGQVPYNPYYGASDIRVEGAQSGNPLLPVIFANLQEATAATVNDIRTAFQIQKLLERDARGGTRYIEIILNHFNVQSPDFRLQRAEYLGGGSGVININPVANTTGTAESSQGDLAATGTGVIKAGFNHSFTEHGYIFGIASARADLTYQNGIERMWDRKTRYDFYWPSLSHLGEQAIKNQEMFVQLDVGGTGINDATWGYQERYAEYRYRPGRITGKMRSNSSAPLDVWHLAQDFDALPPLNKDFLREQPPIDRVVAVPAEPDFIVDGWIRMMSTRPMPVYSVPGLIDHF